MQYDSHKSNDRAYNQMNETVLTVGLGLHLHKSTLSKHLVDLMSDLGFCYHMIKRSRLKIQLLILYTKNKGK